MEWYLILGGFFGVLFLLMMLLGIHVSFAFLITNTVFLFILMNIRAGMEMMVLGMYEAISQFSLTPIPLFVLMGEFLFNSGAMMRVMDEISRRLGKIPGRLSVIAIASGTLFGAMSGSALANTSLLGTTLGPDMKNRGYDDSMIIGPIAAAGGLAMIVPPSGVAIILGSLSKTPIGDLLIAGVVPGLIMATLFAVYILLVCKKDPAKAPTYELEKELSGKEKLNSFFINLLPTLLLIGLVLGSFFLGIATPTESAAIGALGAFVIGIMYKRMNMEVIVKSVKNTVKSSCMILFIMATASTFSQLLSLSGATTKLVRLVTQFSLPSGMLIAVMLLVVVVLGMIMDQNSIMMITVPLFLPLLQAMNVNLVWFGLLMLISLGLGNITPPFGLQLFVLKGLMPEVSMATIIRSVIPIILIEVLVIVIVFFVPMLATWLPSLM